MRSVRKDEATGPLLFRNPWIIACSFSVVLYYYYTSFRTTQRFSDKYRALFKDTSIPASYSGLHKSWLSPLIHDRPMDLKDPQWHACREAFPILSAAALSFLLASNLVQLALRSADLSAFQKVVRRSWFYTIYGLLFLYVLHDASVVKPLGFIFANYLLAMMMRGARAAPYVTWCYTVLSLMLVNAGYYDRIAWILRDPSWLVSSDVRKGLYPWTTCFNLLILRLQSFNMDYWWALQRETRAVTPLTKLSGTGKREVHHPSHYYEVLTVYVGYVCYAPLYIAGPVITFENFLSHQVDHPDEHDWRYKALYALRLVGAVLLLEVLNHYAYVGAITHMAFRHFVSQQEGVGIPLLEYLARFDGSLELDLGGIIHYSHWMLIFLWLKFLIIWRFFRIWALLDNIYPPENMKKCVNSNYSVTGFWRGWHCSFNEWLIKYVYIPLGGSRVSWGRQLFNFFLVFTFVALWHDIEAKLLVWSVALTVFSLPHILGSRFMQTATYKRFAASNEDTIVILAAVCGSANILMLKTANVIGFALGVQGMTMVHTKAKLTTFLPFLFAHFSFMTANAFLSQTIEYWRSLPGEIKRKS